MIKYNPNDLFAVMPSVARAAKTIRDITEEKAIQRNAVVSVEDFDELGGDEGIFFVEYEGRIYAATPDELKA